MSEQDARTPAEQEGEGPLTGKAVSRRQFLKVAGIAGAAIGAGAGLGGLLAACGGEAETTTTTTAGDATTTTAGATTTSAGATTTVSAGAEAGAEIKCGYVLPITGAMAAFGAAASWEIDYFNKNVWKDGLVLGDGKLHKITVLVQDMQSDSNRAAQVAGDLITNSKVTLIGASASAANVVRCVTRPKLWNARASPTTARATPGTPASRTVVSSGAGIPGSSSRIWPPTSSVSGARFLTTRRSGVSSPTTPTA
jgi:hypothetical protein